MSEEKNELDWRNSSNWNEYDWETALKKGDKFAHSYFKLLNRFGDFPDRMNIIEDQLKSQLQKDQELVDSDFLLASDAALFSEEFSELSEEEVMDELTNIENNPTYMNLKKTSLGWCNILSSLLREEDKEIGLKILYYLGRCLATMICTLESKPGSTGSTAFIKRTLFYLNACIGLLHKLKASHPSITVVLSEVIKHLSQIHDDTVDALVDSRKIRANQDDIDEEIEEEFGDDGEFDDDEDFDDNEEFDDDDDMPF